MYDDKQAKGRNYFKNGQSIKLKKENYWIPKEKCQSIV